ncbi:MAG: metallopeptidase TldD-related protein [Candidatus Saccharibacteria bacterium]
MKPQDIISTLLESSKADDCMVILYDQSSANLRWANSSLTTNGTEASRQLIVLSVIDKAVGMASRSFADATNLLEIVRESEQACEFQTEAEDYAELLDMPKSAANWDDAIPMANIDQLGSIVAPLSDAFRESKTHGELLFGFAERTISSTFVANSKGLRKRHDQISGKIEITAKSEDFTRSAWSGEAVSDFTKVDVAAHIAKLHQRLEWSKTKLDLPAGQYDTLLEPSAVSDLMIYMYWTASAREANEGRSVFSAPNGKTKVGQTLTKRKITMYSDPDEPGFEVAPFGAAGGSSSSSSVFDNGMVAEKQEWIKDGVLNQLVSPRYWAEQQGTKPVAYVDNLILEAGGSEDLDAMIKKTKRGLLVTCLWYIREVDPTRLLLTGLTRDGVFLIEDGEVKGAVNNFRFNMSPVEMLENIEDAGASVAVLAREWGDYFNFAKMPPLMIRDFNMSSVSQAT